MLFDTRIPTLASLAPAAFHRKLLKLLPRRGRLESPDTPAPAVSRELEREELSSSGSF